MASQRSPRLRGERKALARTLPAERAVLSPFRATLERDWVPSLLLLLASAVALIWANSPWGGSYHELLERHAIVDLVFVKIDFTVHHWINDCLMVFFFFLAGLEIKAELAHGELSDPRKAMLPVAAAIGGMAAPALVYLAFCAGTPAAVGWGIPMATDIAFAVGVLALMGKRAPASLRIFLLALAIADDIGSILVIAVFYSQGIAASSLIWAGVWIAAWAIMWRSGVPGLVPYLIVGFLTWSAVHESGVHATIAGVVLGLMTPARARISLSELAETAVALGPKFRHEVEEGHWDSAQERLGELAAMTRVSESPVEKLERELAPWASLVILPLFALANAGVELGGESPAQLLKEPVLWSVALGLLVGKPLGIVGMSWLMVKAGFSRLPTGVNWVQMLGAGLIAGIGFTVSLFVASLAFAGAEHSSLLADAKLGILGGSIVAALIGLIVLARSNGHPTDGDGPEAGHVPH